MKRRRFSFLALLMLAVILLMPATTQAAAEPGTVKLTGIKAITTKSILNGGRLPELRITSYTIKKPEPANGLR